MASAVPVLQATFSSLMEAEWALLHDQEAAGAFSSAAATFSAARLAFESELEKARRAESPSDAAENFGSVFEECLGAFCAKLLSSEGDGCFAVSLEAWSKSTSLEALSSLHNAIVRFLQELTGLVDTISDGYPLAVALEAMLSQEKEVPQKLIEQALAWFASEVCEKLWGISDPFGDYKKPGPGGFDESSWMTSPLAVCAIQGNVSLMPLILSKAKKTNIVAALLCAYSAGQKECFVFLSNAGNSLGAELADSMPLIAQFLLHYNEKSPTVGLHESIPTSAATKDARLDMLASFVQRWPESLHDRWVYGKCRENVLSGAILHGQDPRLVAMLLKEGASICYDWTTETIDGNKVETFPTLFEALIKADKAIIDVLLEHGAFEPTTFRDKYTDKGLGSVARGLSRVALSAYTYSKAVSPAKDGNMFLPHNPDNLLIVQEFFRRGFKHNWNGEGLNAWTAGLFAKDVCLLEEKAALSYCRMVKANGMEVVPIVYGPGPEDYPWLFIHQAARHGLTSLVDYAVEELGCPVDSLACVGAEPNAAAVASPLTLALKEGNTSLAIHLLKKHKARVVYDGVLSTHQLLSVLLGEKLQSNPQSLNAGLTDSAAALVLRELINRAGDDKGALLRHEEFERPELLHPIQLCCMFRKVKCLSMLLELPGAKELCLQQVHNTRNDGNREEETSLHFPAKLGSWDVVATVLRSMYVPVLLRPKVFSPDGAVVDYKPSLFEMIAGPEAPKGTGAPPRTLVTLVKMRAKKEKEDEKTTEANARAAVLATSNAFEDTTKAIASERQEKQKAKKKANKKKARAKKRAKAKEASAGAGKAGDDTDSSDYDGTEEEEDEFEPGKEHLIDSRNAPDLTVMLAVRKAARAKEEEERARKEHLEGEKK
jgi:hypothetical protein